MPSLLDIAPVAETIVIRGDAYPVKGLGIGTITALLARFPALTALVGGGKFDFAAIAAASEDAIAAILAAGLGHAGEAEYEAALSHLALDEQAEVFAKILKLTMPGGVVPFVQSLEKVMSAVTTPGSTPAQGGKARSTKSQKS